MEKRTTGQVLFRARAVSNPSYMLGRVRTLVAELYSWSISGGQDPIVVLMRVADISAYLHRVYGLAAAFAGKNGMDDIAVFFEEARMDAAKWLATEEA